MRLVLIALVTGLLAQPVIAGSLPPPPTISGTARVIDGDTISIRKQCIRLAAIDACEVDQAGFRRDVEWPCGKVARSFMRSIADGKHVECRVIDMDQYRRLVAQCFESGRDVGLAILAAGLAETLFRYLPKQHRMELKAYVAAEERAKAARLEMWSAEIEKPSEYRQSRQTTPRTGRS